MKSCLICVLSKLCLLISGGLIKISFNDQHLIQVEHINSRFITEEDKHRWCTCMGYLQGYLGAGGMGLNLVALRG